MVASAWLRRGAVVFCLAVAGCHGGGSSAAPVANPGAASLGSASFTVVVPPPGSSGATPQSVSITLLQVNSIAPSGKTSPTTANLSSSSSGCAPLPGGALSCTVSVSAPIGNDTFTIVTYAAQNATGAPIATTQAQASIDGRRTTTCVQNAVSTAAPGRTI